MAKLYFYYTTMNAGKSTALSAAAHNYAERGMKTLLFTARLDDRAAGRIESASDSARCPAVRAGNRCWEQCPAVQPHCVLIDEAQFLSKDQVRRLSRVVDEANIPVMCVRIADRFSRRAVSRDAALLAWADSLAELKTICCCGRKATMVVRTVAHWCSGTSRAAGRDRRQRAVRAVCRKHFTGIAANREMRGMERGRVRVWHVPLNSTRRRRSRLLCIPAARFAWR